MLNRIPVNAPKKKRVIDTAKPKVRLSNYLDPNCISCQQKRKQQ